VIRVTIRHAHCDKFRVEDLNLDAQFLQPPLVQKNRVGAHPMTRQHSMLLDDLPCGLGHCYGCYTERYNDYKDIMSAANRIQAFS
jgi:hypothetical protein